MKLGNKKEEARKRSIKDRKLVERRDGREFHEIHFGRPCQVYIHIKMVSADRCACYVACRAFTVGVSVYLGLFGQPCVSPQITAQLLLTFAWVCSSLLTLAISHDKLDFASLCVVYRGGYLDSRGPDSASLIHRVGFMVHKMTLGPVPILPGTIPSLLHTRLVH